jgi:DNA modification methylase
MSDLFADSNSRKEVNAELKSDAKEKLTRLDLNEELKQQILLLCRLKYGEIWEDENRGHRIGVLDATKENDIAKLFNGEKAKLIINDPPYNVIAGNKNTKNIGKTSLDAYIEFSLRWLENTLKIMDGNSSLYIWLGADQNDGYQPLPDFMLMMRQFQELRPRSFITMRNQRGYGTQKNWMAVRQELLYYIKGNPVFNVEAEYTEIPKILRGYYKQVGGKLTENQERSKSAFIRAGNVWVDIQQVFYRMEENVPGAYAQKPLKAINRIVQSSSLAGDLVGDFFSHSGTTLISAEMLKRKCLTCDIDPVFAELTIRRLENYRENGKTGWQWNNPFPEISIKEFS